MNKNNNGLIKMLSIGIMSKAGRYGGTYAHKDIAFEFGSGFFPVSIRRMRKFYEIYPIWSAVPTELSWSHFQELIRVDRKEERKFYENESIKSNWGYRELGRQINTSRYWTNADVCQLL